MISFKSIRNFMVTVIRVKTRDDLFDEYKDRTISPYYGNSQMINKNAIYSLIETSPLTAIFHDVIYLVKKDRITHRDSINYKSSSFHFQGLFHKAYFCFTSKSLKIMFRHNLDLM